MTERLETIKEVVRKIESILYDEWRQKELTNLIESLYYNDHVDWLINRVEELEEEVEKQKNRKYLKMRQRDDFLKKAQRYKQALENITISPIPLEIDDAVNIARQALEGEE